MADVNGDNIYHTAARCSNPTILQVRLINITVLLGTSLLNIDKNQNCKHYVNENVHLKLMSVNPNLHVKST